MFYIHWQLAVRIYGINKYDDDDDDDTAKGSKFREIRWPSDRPTTSFHFSGNFKFKNSVTSSWKVEMLHPVRIVCHQFTSRTGMWNSSNLSSYITPVTVGLV
jgi:hypothetical protein